MAWVGAAAAAVESIAGWRRRGRHDTPSSPARAGAHGTPAIDPGGKATPVAVVSRRFRSVASPHGRRIGERGGVVSAEGA